jgi:tetratricopeptide (TPR) repeat protein
VEPAVRDLKLAAELAPMDGRVESELGDVLSELGEYVEATSYFQAAVDLEYLPEINYFLMGENFRRAGDFRKALAAFEQSRAHGDDSEFCATRIRECKSHLDD